MEEAIKNRLRKLKTALEWGITCNINTGEVFNIKGKPINTKCNGYLVFTFKGEMLKNHQLIYYVLTGEVPESIDHINGDRADNRGVNLRAVTPQQNQWNLLYAKGYSFVVSMGKWKARIRSGTKLVHLGYFDKEQDARKAYLKAKEKVHKIDEDYSKDAIEERFKNLCTEFKKETKGCRYKKKNKKWVAYTRCEGKHKHLGYFLTEQEAREAYLKAKNNI